jgi:hypothetical protein
VIMALALSTNFITAGGSSSNEILDKASQSAPVAPNLTLPDSVGTITPADTTKP